MNIVPDPILLALQVLPFLATLIALHYILFKPMLAYLQEREVAIGGAQKDARQMQERAEALVAVLGERMVRAREEAGSLRAELHDEAARKRDEMLHAARSEAEARNMAARKEIQSARDAASALLAELVHPLAEDIVGQVLRRPTLSQ